jgi:peroxisomal membrane protein 2
MAVYGGFISAPLNHVLVGRLQKVFAGKTAPKDRILQILANSVLVAPITTVGMSEVRACMTNVN